MHICFIGEIATARVKTGGIGSFVANLIPELIKKGNAVTVISFKKQQAAVEMELAAGFTIYWINTHQWGPLRFLKKTMDTNRLLKQIHRKKPLQIVETSEAGLFLLKKNPAITYVVRLHGGHVFFANSTADTPYSSKKAWMEKLSLQKADAIIGVSKYVLDTTNSLYPFMRHTTQQVIYNPIVLERFFPSDPSKQQPGKILFLGSLTEKKGIRQLIEAMPAVNKSCSGAWLHIYGRDIPIRPSGHSFKVLLQDKITELGLTNVTLHDPVPNHEMPGIIESAAVVVLPSHMEAMPLAWLEALAMEKIFIGGNPGPGPEIIEHGKNGLLCNPFDPNDIADKITQVLMDPKAAAAMGKTAREKIVRYFGSETIAEENDVFFKKLCAVSV